MAIPVGFQGSNSLYEGAGRVGDLPVFADEKSVTSCWRLNEEELAEIAATGVVWVRSEGRIVYPFSVSGTALVEYKEKPAKAEPILTRVPK